MCEGILLMVMFQMYFVIVVGGHSVNCDIEFKFISCILFIESSVDKKN